MKKGKKSKSFSAAKKPEVNVRIHHFANPEERQELLMNLAISSQFDMRYRGLLDYYGKELVAYKREHTSDKANEFLRVLSSFMTDCLEDNCPPSWQECNNSFWEELIFTYFPHNMKISQKRKQSENFLMQLKEYVHWLDQRVGTSWYPVVDKLSLEAFPQLLICEHLLNDIFLKDFPLIHHPDWNPSEDWNKMEHEFANCEDQYKSIFEVTGLLDETAVLSDSNSNKTFYIKGLPTKSIEPGFIMAGVIGKKRNEKAWKWFQTDGVYPNRGKAYLILLTPVSC